MYCKSHGEQKRIHVRVHETLRNLATLYLFGTSDDFGSIILGIAASLTNPSKASMEIGIWVFNIVT